MTATDVAVLATGVGADTTIAGAAGKLPAREVSGHLKLTSVAKLKDQSCDWTATASSRSEE